MWIRLAALVVLVGCSGGPETSFGSGERTERPTPRPPTDDDDDDAPLRDPCLPGPCPDGGCGVAGAGYTYLEDLDATAPCPELGRCDDDYRAFLGAAADHGEPIGQLELRDAVRALQNGEVPFEEGPLEAEDLVDALNLGFLLDGLEERALTVRELGARPRGDGVEVDLVIEDPWVGTFSALLLLPEGDGPFAGLAVHPGHWQDAAAHADTFFGDALLQVGFAQLILDPRVHDAEQFESAMTRDLLLAGHTFMALRVYETLLLRAILRAHPRVHPDYVGLYGHSGGSASGNLAVRLDAGWFAMVTDLHTDYLSVTAQWLWLDDATPSLYPWGPLINDVGTLDVPARSFPYGYPDGDGEVIEAFCRAVR